MAPHSSTLAWKIPWTEEPGRLQSMGSLRVGHDWATSLSLFTFMHWRRKWQPTPVLLPGESHAAWWAAVHGVTQSWTQLKWRSNSNKRYQEKGSHIQGSLNKSIIWLLYRPRESGMIQETHFRPKVTYRLKVRGWKNIFHANVKQKKAGVAILIPDKIDLRKKNIPEIRKDTT